MKKLFTCAAIAAAALASMSAQAVVISYGGQNATDGSGKTSSRIDSSNQLAYGNGYFIETFDLATQMTGVPGNPAPLTTTPVAPAPNAGAITFPQGSGCSFNSYNALGVTVTGGGFSSLSGKFVGADGYDKAAPPAGDNTCYGVSPIPNSLTDTASVTVDYEELLRPGEYINYLGLYYGSIDKYNDLYFFNADGVEVARVLGSTVLGLLPNCPPGNQSQECSNVYVNLDFGVGEGFTSFEFRTTGVAVEVDNIVVGTNFVPEPASLALMGLGLAGLGLARRRKSKN